jgi:hypothetical protein
MNKNLPIAYQPADLGTVKELPMGQALWPVHTEAEVAALRRLADQLHCQVEVTERPARIPIRKGAVVALCRSSVAQTSFKRWRVCAKKVSKAREAIQ